VSEKTDLLNKTVRFARTVWGILFFTQILYVLTAERFRPDAPTTPPTLVLAAPVFIYLLLGLVFRKIKVWRAGELLRADSDNQQAINNWRSGQIITMVLAEAVVLTGFMLRFMGAPLNHSAAIYALGMAAMICFFPKKPRI
jgi:hypothetical protein